MDKVAIGLVAEEAAMDGELVELGSVTEDTQGGSFGWDDGGGTWCFC